MFSNVVIEETRGVAVAGKKGYLWEDTQTRIDRLREAGLLVEDELPTDPVALKALLAAYKAKEASNGEEGE